MKNVSMEDRIEKFIQEIQKRWADIDIRYEYDAKDDIWDMWHHHAELEYQDLEFQRLAGNLIRTIFYDQGIFNISFGYKHVRRAFYEYTPVQWVLSEGETISPKWVAGLPVQSLTSLSITPVSRIFLQRECSVNSQHYYNYKPNPVMAGKFGSLEGRNEVLVA
ncbi:MAG TPA: hypothetical protein GX504_02140 [Clostridia bacterium]|nr:hypothetical protein [Clostridia bacterium]